MKDKKIMSGSYTLILYGARHGEDLETVAFLDYEGDDIAFEPFAREDDYTIKKHLGEEEVLTEAVKFISWYPSFLSARLSRIIDEQERMLGYELRPLYMRTSTYGYSDVLNVNYRLQDKKVVIRISLKRDVESAIEGDERPLLRRRRR